MATKKKDVSIRSSAAEYLTFIAATGESNESVEMRYEDENIWLTQKMMAVLYDVDIRTINEHIKRVFSDRELPEDPTIRKFRIVQTEGTRQVTRDALHYNLNMIIAVGFKVNSERAVQFRKWVNEIASTYTIKGWVMDDERLKKGGTVLTKQYFEEQLEKIREIRMSERLFYQKVTDLYATAIDYDKDFSLIKDRTNEMYDFIRDEIDYYNPDTREVALGDIVLCVPKIYSQAKEYNHSILREYAFLITHSMLHLLGFDHMEDDERRIMEAKQTKILESLDITRDL